jgi:hypothetical protein
MKKRTRIIRKVVHDADALTMPFPIECKKARSDCVDFFRLNDMRKPRPHHPFMVFSVEGEGVSIKVMQRAQDLGYFDLGCMVLVQWPGKTRSDWFQTTVEEVLDALNAWEAEAPDESA